MEKQILNFTVNEQILVCENPIKISTNKVNYIQAHFDLGENWDGFDSVRAVWFNDFNCISTVLDSLGNCVVPFEVMKRKGNVKVNLVGSISEDDVLTDRLTSYPVVAVIVDCTAQIVGSNTQPITPSEFEQFAQRVHTDADRAETAATNAETFAQNAHTSEQNASQSAQSAHDDKIAIEEAIAEVIQQIDDFEQVQVVVNTLPPSSQATSDFTDGVLTLGIPQGVKGDTGNGIQSVTKTGTSGLVDTYTITFTDGQTTTFTVTNGAKGDTGNGIASIEKTSTVGLVDTYTITYTDGTTSTFTVTNGEKGDKGDTGEVSQAELDEAITDLKSDLSERTINLSNIKAWSSANSSMSVSNAVATNVKSDTRTFLQLLVLTYNGSSLVDTVYNASETVRKKALAFTASGNADSIRLKHSGSSQDLYVTIPTTITSGQTYTISFDITGANPTVLGGVTFEKIQTETGASATAYIPYITATDYVARNDIAEINSDLPYIFDGEYASRYLLTAKDYLTKTGKYIRTTGSEADSANHNASDYIRVHNGDVLSYTLRGSDSGVSVVYLYDADKNPVQSVALGTAYNQDVTGTYTAPFDGYVRICTRVDHESPIFQIGSGGKLLGIKALIADLIANTEEYPSYWQEDVDDAITRYYAKSELVADHGVSFAYVTDTHWAFNAQNSSRLISHIFEKTNLNVAVHGGDFVRYGAEDIYGFMQYIDKGIKFLPVIGNHEYDTSVGITTSQDYAYAFKQSENIFTHRQGFNYCYDDNAQRVRFISLDYNDANCITLLETWSAELSAGWSIVVLSHMYWGGAPRGSTPTITQIGESLADTIDALNLTINAEIILFLVGHVHRDLNTTTPDGVPIVSTNCDAYADSQSYDWGGHKMYADDTTSQCIDLVNIDTTNKNIYMTRLGVGSDRAFNY